MERCQKLNIILENKNCLKIDVIKKYTPDLIFCNKKILKKIQIIFDLEN